MNAKLIQFSLLIPVNGRMREFNFRQRNAGQYDGNTTDERGERFYFKLSNEKNEWFFGSETLPAWLLDSEKAIGQAVMEYAAAS